jgi:hypothetical protein
MVGFPEKLVVPLLFVNVPMMVELAKVKEPLLVTLPVIVWLAPVSDTVAPLLMVKPGIVIVPELVRLNPLLKLVLGRVIIPVPALVILPLLALRLLAVRLPPLRLLTLPPPIVIPALKVP